MTDRTRRRVVTATTLLALTVVVMWVAWERCGIRGCPDPERLERFVPAQASVVLDRRGVELARLYPVDRVMIPIDSLPDHVPAAFVAVEDQRFWDHGGVDWKRVMGATLANLRSGGIEQGASTITMQLARNAFPDRLPYRDRTFTRKILEVRVAREIEARYTKRQILEMYLNRIYFGAGAWGIEAAAQEYFDTHAKALTMPEAALLAGLPSAPHRLNPRRNPRQAWGRRKVVLDLMAMSGVVTETEAARAAAAPLVTGEGTPERARHAPYFVQSVRSLMERELGRALYTGSLIIHTTLDAELQAVAEAELGKQLDAVESGRFGEYDHPGYGRRTAAGDSTRQGSSYLQGAVVALDASTGDVLTMVGGRNFDHSRFNRATLARRQPASTFKPFLLAAALSSGYTPIDRLGNRPMERRTGSGDPWTPRNLLGRYSDSISIRDAMIESNNVALIRLAEQVGLNRVAEMARRLGLEGPFPRVPALALGVGEVSLINLTAAYAAFATLGRRPEPRLVARVEDRDGGVVWRRQPRTEQVLDPGVAFLVTDILRDAVNQGTAFGVRAAGYTGPAAGKTGTTNDATDIWFVGYTPAVVAGIWIGFDMPRPIAPDVTASHVAAPVWGRMMRGHAAGDPESWSAPLTIERVRVDTTGQAYPADCRIDVRLRAEYFLPGTAPRVECPARDTVRAQPVAEETPEDSVAADPPDAR